MPTRTLPILAALVLTVWTRVPAAQFAASSDLVVLNVRVADRHDRHVRGLDQRAFTVYEDGRPQTVTLFASDDAPVTVGVLIDSSVSMWAVSEQLIAGATAFAAASHPGNELFAIAFNDARWPALPPRAPFTSDAAQLQTALRRVIQPRGKTALFDAISAGLDYASRGSHPRKALVVLSDGGDNASAATFEDVIAKTQSSNTVIYGVILVDPVAGGARPDVLRRLARSSGGEALQPARIEDVQASLTRIAEDIRRSYVLGYVPRGSTPGARHSLRVVATAADRQNLKVRTREEYREAPARTAVDAVNDPADTEVPTP